MPEPAASGPRPDEPSRFDSFEDFYRAEFPRMVAWAWALSGNRAVAEEIAQEAMLRAFDHWDRVSGYERPGAWVRRVTANLASSARKRRRIEVAALRRLPAPLVPIDSGLEDETFWELVRALPTRQRHAVVLFYLEDLPVDEIAAVLGCAANTAKAHLHKGRRRLERELTKQRASS